MCVVKTVLMPVVFLDGRKEPKEIRRKDIKAVEERVSKTL